MKKTLTIMTFVGLLICVAPAVQIFLPSLNPSNLDYYEVYTRATFLFIAFFGFFGIVPILFFHFLMRYFYIDKTTSIWGQVAVGLLAVFLYLVPILLSLAWVTDIDGFRTSDGLNGIAYFMIIIYSAGFSIVPAIVLAISQKHT
jgi:hypothetical protein